MSSNSFFPTTNTPARISATSRTLTNNILFYDSDNLTQQLVVINKPTTLCSLNWDVVFINFWKEKPWILNQAISMTGLSQNF